MPHVLVYLCMLAVLMGSTLHVQHVTCHESYAACIVKGRRYGFVWGIKLETFIDYGFEKQRW